MQQIRLQEIPFDIHDTVARREGRILIVVAALKKKLFGSTPTPSPPTLFFRTIFTIYFTSVPASVAGQLPEQVRISLKTRHKRDNKAQNNMTQKERRQPDNTSAFAGDMSSARRRKKKWNRFESIAPARQAMPNNKPQT